jgi:DNA polymerase bacteriophage-type
MLNTPRFKHIAHMDFESYYDSKTKYSLKYLPTITYVRDPRFEVFGCAVALDDEPSRYLTGDDLTAWILAVNWEVTALQAFNCLFDGTVLNFIYNKKPCYYLCSLSVSRALLPCDRHSLKGVAPLLDLGHKGNGLVDGAKGNTDKMEAYANTDNELARGIYKMLYPMLPPAEHDVINLTIRQGVEPTLVLDTEILTQVRDDAERARNIAILASGYSEATLNSNAKFADVIAKLGLKAPVKISDATGEETNAFANGDDEYVSFTLEYPQYKHIWEGRRAAKSNINITRPNKLLAIAATGPMPMPLNYWGAHTGRASGADGLNVQNLPNKYKSNIRKAFRAPKGFRVVVIDSAQIELRLNFWQSGQLDKLDVLTKGGCVYVAEAVAQFGIDIGDAVPKKGMVSDDQRQYGKLCQLGLGYGMGAKKFQKTAAAGPLGMDPIYMDLNQAYNTVMTYREANSKIPKFWRKLDQRIHQMTLPDLHEEDGCITFVHNGILLPSGRMLQFNGLRQNEECQWLYGVDKKMHFLWGGTLDENITQALARDVVFEQMMKIDERYRVVSSTHDEVLYLAPEAEAEEALAFGIEVFSKTPDWAPGLTLSAEGAHAEYYCK